MKIVLLILLYIILSAQICLDVYVIKDKRYKELVRSDYWVIISLLMIMLPILSLIASRALDNDVLKTIIHSIDLIQICIQIIVLNYVVKE